MVSEMISRMLGTPAGSTPGRGCGVGDWGSVMLESGDDRRAFFEEFVELMYRRRDVRAAFGSYVAVDYVQHNPGLADGRDAARDALAEKFADPAFSIDVERMLVDGDFCVLHLCPRRDGRPSAAVVDIYRAEGDRIVEHWDVIQPWPATSANEHPMF
jgi:predicted SnoaL-like aldol condensation-catalyzing enzyme